MPPRAARHLLLLAIAVATLAAILGCSAYPRQGSMTAPVNTGMGEIKLEVIWHDSVESAHDRCWPSFRQSATFYHGCAFLHRATGQWKCEVHAVPPKDWNDLPALQVLGHEVAHCFQAKHGG